MKYFIGIATPPGISQKISDFQKSFPSNKLPYIFEPHITVKSHRGLTEDQEWISIAEKIIKAHSQFEISFKGITSFTEKVIILEPTPSTELTALHKALYTAIRPIENGPQVKYFENDEFHAHITLGMSSWGMTIEELAAMKQRASIQFTNLPLFTVTYLRIYVQRALDTPFVTLKDIPLNTPH